MTRRKYVDVQVSWCYGECDPATKVSLQDWQAILKGEKVDTSAVYWYEGKQYNAYFAFNYDGLGTLQVGYDDGGVGFDGSITDAVITGGVYPDEHRLT